MKAKSGFSEINGYQNEYSDYDAEMLIGAGDHGTPLTKNHQILDNELMYDDGD